MPTDTFTLNGKRLTAFKQKYRFCGKHQSKDVLVCHSDKINIAVSNHDNDYHYAAWSKSRATPDLFLQNSDVRIDGTGQNHLPDCLQIIFTSVNGVYVLILQKNCVITPFKHVYRISGSST